MPHINLLPYREKARERRTKSFRNIAVGAAILMLGAIAFVHIQVEGMISTQNSRNNFMELTIKKVEKEIEEIRTLKEDKEALLARMEVIQKLQRSRPEIVHLFEEIAKSTPKGVYLLSAARQGNMIDIEGVANSNDSVSAFMRQLDASSWLTNPRLEVIDSSKQQYPDQSWFKLKVQQQEQSKENETADGAAKGAKKS